MAIGTAPVTSSQISVSKTAAVTSDTQTLGVTPTATNVVFLHWGVSAAGQSISSATETNVTWSRVGAVADANATTELWMGVAAASPGNVVTINTAVSMATSNIRGCAFEWSGLDTATVPSVSGKQGTASGGQWSTNSIAPTAGAECLIIAFGRLGVAGLGAYVSTDGGFTEITPEGSGNGRCAYRYVASASGSYQCTWTYTTGGATPYDTGIVVFYGAAASAFKAAFARNANSYIPGP
jgi:hypothetical protein